MSATQRQLDVKYLELSIDAAISSVKKGNKPFGAVITKDNLIVSIAENQELRPVPDPTNHAEMAAIRAACRTSNRSSLKGATLYSSNSPCSMCLSACELAEVSRIVYATGSGEGAGETFGGDKMEKIEKDKVEVQDWGKPFKLWRKNTV